MSGSNASHGWWCSARTFPMRCRYCHQQVFYFSCNCGSKVFFDELGGLWREHSCLERHKAEIGNELLGHLMAQQMMRPGIKRKIVVDDGYRERITKSFHRLRKPEIKRRVPEPAETVTDLGFLREVVSPIDIYRIFDFERTSIAHALLGSLVREPHVQITLHSGDLSKEDVASYTCLIPLQLLKQSGCAKGDLVSFELRASTVVGRPSLWIAVNLERDAGC